MGVVITLFVVLLSPILLPILLIGDPAGFMELMKYLPQAALMLLISPFMGISVAVVGIADLLFPFLHISDGLTNIIQYINQFLPF